MPIPAQGRFEGTRFLFPLRVYFEDTDTMGIVYYPNYLKWFERARWEMLRAAGVDLLASQSDGRGAYAVSEVQIKYHRSARLDDAVTVISELVELRASSVLVQQKAMREDELLASARLRVAFISPEGRPRRQPRDWMQIFEPLLSKDSE